MRGIRLPVFCPVNDRENRSRGGNGYKSERLIREMSQKIQMYALHAPSPKEIRASNLAALAVDWVAGERDGTERLSAMLVVTRKVSRV